MVVLLALPTPTVLAAAPRLVMDINTANDQYPYDLTDVGGTLYLAEGIGLPGSHYGIADRIRRSPALLGR